MTAEALTLQADGCALAATLYPPQGDVRAACLINGALAVPQRFYGKFATWLASHGVAVLTYDYRGMHASLVSHVRESSATASDWGRKDTAAALDHLATSFPGAPLMLIAQSMGGHVFPLAGRAAKISRILTITSQSGYWRLWPSEGQWARVRRYYLEMPLAARMLGFVPSRARLGADLPAGVALEWARWCRAPGYVADERFGYGPCFEAITAPMTCVGFSDDLLAPRAAVNAYAGFFPNAPRDVVWIEPKDHDISEVACPRPGKVGEMTIITVRAPHGLIGRSARRELARSLTDAVLTPEIGRFDARAKMGFQVHFLELAHDFMAIGGMLLCDQPSDVLSVDVAVMAGDWPKADRIAVITGVLSALADALKRPAPEPTWWVNFRVIEEGSWGSRGGVLSIIDLLETEVFAPDKAAAIRANLGDDR